MDLRVSCSFPLFFCQTITLMVKIKFMCGHLSFGLTDFQPYFEHCFLLSCVVLSETFGHIVLGKINKYNLNSLVTNLSDREKIFETVGRINSECKFPANLGPEK